MWGWAVDVLLGWIVGSIVGATVFGLITAAAGASDDAVRTANGLGVVAGTILGIWAMRRWRVRRESRVAS